MDLDLLKYHDAQKYSVANVLLNVSINLSTQHATLHHSTADIIHSVRRSVGGASFFKAPIRNKTLLSLSFSEVKAIAMLICVRKYQATHPNEAKDYTVNRLHEITHLHALTVEKRVKTLRKLGIVGTSERKLVTFLRVRAKNDKHNTIITIDEKATIKDIEKTILATRLQMKKKQKDYMRNVISIAKDGYTSDGKKAKLKDVKKARLWLREHCDVDFRKRGFVDFGWSFKSIAKYLGVSLKTAFEAVKYAVINNFLVKKTHSMFKKLTSVRYETEFIQHTYKHNGYSVKVWANSYSLPMGGIY